MLFSSSLVLFGVLSVVRGHPNHHHHRAIARQVNAVAAPPPGPSPSVQTSNSAAATPSQQGPPGGLIGPSAPPVSSHSGPTTTLPDATLTATDPAIPPLSQITSGMPSSTPAFTYVVTPGAPGPFPGAPPLPSTTLDIAKYPSPTELAPTDSPMMAEWLKELEGVQIPNIPPTVAGATCSGNPDAAADLSRCWWTCGGCRNPNDVSTCPDKFTWGLTFDDGPSPQTPLVHQFLRENNLNATFYAIGGNTLYFSQVLTEGYMQGHQVAVHTWVHPHMTTLSTLEVIAELGLARKIITETLGVTPSFWRPPYGDVDERVRAIAHGMGMITSLWTRDPISQAQFDTNDWEIASGGVTGPQAFQQFENILANASQLESGFIVLEHDLYRETVDLAVGYTIPTALKSVNPKFTLKSVIDCQNLPMSEAYNETRTQPLPKFTTSWSGQFITVEEILAQSGSNVSIPGVTGPNGTSLPSKGGSSGSLALTATLSHVMLILLASTLAVLLRS